MASPLSSLWNWLKPRNNQALSALKTLRNEKGIDVESLSTELRTLLERVASPEVKRRQKLAEELACHRFEGQPDKMKHAAMTALISGVAWQLTGKPWEAVAVTLGVGAAKELMVDGTFLNPKGQRDYHGPKSDMAANTLGALVGAGLYPSHTPGSRDEFVAQSRSEGKR